MKSAHLLSLLLIGLLFSPVAHATEGRAAPSCAYADVSDVVSNSNGIEVEPGACVIVSIGVRSHTTTLAIDYEVLDDAMDVLLFNQVGIQTYENGQSYHSYFVNEASFESMLGSEWLDWSPPVSGTAKNWFIVFDNLAHDGDQNMGDQGGMTGRFKLQLAPIASEDHPLYHDTLIVPAGEKVNLASEAVDGGTVFSYWAHPISGSGELFVQSDNQIDSDLRIADTSIENIGAQDRVELDWTVPAYLDSQNLNLVVEADTGSDLHLSVKAWFDPVIDPRIEDLSGGTANIGDEVVFNAGNTPNSLGQILSYSWDFDSDGITDSSNVLADYSWNTPGNKTVTLTVATKSGETKSTTHYVEIIDDISPVAIVTGDGQRLSNGDWRLPEDYQLNLSSSSSTDNHQVASQVWYDGLIPIGNDTEVTVSWPEIGTYSLRLIVLDSSGNTGSTNITIVVYDRFDPILETSEITSIEEIIVGESIEFKAKAVDPGDEQSTLIFTWDLDLTDDSNNDGDARNDPDYTGSTLTKEFTSVGEHSFAVTVTDPSGNTDFEVFTVEVSESPAQTSSLAVAALIIAVIIVVAGVVLFGHRGIQKRHAIQLLMDAGLSASEAESRIQSTMRTNKMPFFAKAEHMAGIADGQEIKSSQQLQSEAKAAELQSIYGDSGSGLQADPNTGFRPASQTRQVDSAFADAALAAFAEDEPAPAVKPSKKIAGKVRSGGVALPGAQPKKNHVLQSECTSCGKPFKIELPNGVNSAVVACPSCGADQFFER